MIFRFTPPQNLVRDSATGSAEAFPNTGPDQQEKVQQEKTHKRRSTAPEGKRDPPPRPVNHFGELQTNKQNA